MIEEKAWYESKTIWGSLVSVCAALIATLGVDIDAGMQQAIAESMVQMLGAIGALYAIYGRLSATQVIS